MIGLIDFLKAAGVEIDIDSLKIHLACWNGRVHPIDEYYAGNFKEWQEFQGQRNFKCAQVLSLIDLRQNNWLFAGVYKVLNCRQRPDGGVRYSTALVKKQAELLIRSSKSAYPAWKRVTECLTLRSLSTKQYALFGDRLSNMRGARDERQPLEPLMAARCSTTKPRESTCRVRPRISP